MVTLFTRRLRWSDVGEEVRRKVRNALNFILESVDVWILTGDDNGTTAIDGQDGGTQQKQNEESHEANHKL